MVYSSQYFFFLGWGLGEDNDAADNDEGDSDDEDDGVSPLQEAAHEWHNNNLQ